MREVSRTGGSFARSALSAVVRARCTCSLNARPAVHTLPLRRAVGDHDDTASICGA